MERNNPVGFFDSGLGGISVLQQTRKLLPAENYLYFGDSLHAPYGIRSAEEVLNLSVRAAERLLSEGAKAIVIACNTATSAAAAELRQRYPEVPIIGTEPALKPAVERHPGGRVLVMATAMTLKEQKFHDLWMQYADQAEIVPVSCTGLMEFVERGQLDGVEVERYLLEKLEPFAKVPVDAVVLGCTHYPFLRPVLRRLLGRSPEILDGAEGVARQLCRQLEIRDLLRQSDRPGQVEFRNSSPEPELLERSEMLLRRSFSENVMQTAEMRIKNDA